MYKKHLHVSSKNAALGTTFKISTLYDTDRQKCNNNFFKVNKKNCLIIKHRKKI